MSYCVLEVAILHLQWAQKDHSLKKPIITMEALIKMILDFDIPLETEE